MEGEARKRGRPIIAVLGVGWIGIGFWSVKDDQMWHAAACVSLGLLWLACFVWPGSRLDRFMSTPLFGRKKRREEVSAPGRG
ncbi:hypothetical protein J2X46_002983 [Nocardioides sp. BE266]|uniref:hypothetical protein n=1 Tax=Nocardioides sp. BE266 TaxID=2817725 RepID=UPI002856B2F4|nr:hypothetical protein [Nocardioides sp. BE266]MDR7253993.1 hypothetical protein [Nocardioides sp. BE266]